MSVSDTLFAYRKENKDMKNNKLTHGLLVESFKQSLADLISQSPLDIQSKSLILDYVSVQVQKMSEQQTNKEIAEYNEEQKKLNAETKQCDKEQI